MSGPERINIFRDGRLVASTPATPPRLPLTHSTTGSPASPCAPLTVPPNSPTAPRNTSKTGEAKRLHDLSCALKGLEISPADSLSRYNPQLRSPLPASSRSLTQASGSNSNGEAAEPSPPVTPRASTSAPAPASVSASHELTTLSPPSSSSGSSTCSTPTKSRLAPKLGRRIRVRPRPKSAEPTTPERTPPSRPSAPTPGSTYSLSPRTHGAAAASASALLPADSPRPSSESTPSGSLRPLGSLGSLSAAVSDGIYSPSRGHALSRTAFAARLRGEDVFGPILEADAWGLDASPSRLRAEIARNRPRERTTTSLTQAYVPSGSESEPESGAELGRELGTGPQGDHGFLQRIVDSDYSDNEWYGDEPDLDPNAAPGSGAVGVSSTSNNAEATADCTAEPETDWFALSTAEEEGLWDGIESDASTPVPSGRRRRAHDPSPPSRTSSASSFGVGPSAFDMAGQRSGAPSPPSRTSSASSLGIGPSTRGMAGFSYGLIDTTPTHATTAWAAGQDDSPDSSAAAQRRSLATLNDLEGLDVWNHLIGLPEGGERPLSPAQASSDLLPPSSGRVLSPAPSPAPSRGSLCPPPSPHGSPAPSPQHALSDDSPEWTADAIPADTTEDMTADQTVGDTTFDSLASAPEVFHNDLGSVFAECGFRAPPLAQPCLPPRPPVPSVEDPEPGVMPPPVILQPTGIYTLQTVEALDDTSAQTEAPTPAWPGAAFAGPLDGDAAGTPTRLAELNLDLAPLSFVPNGDPVRVTPPKETTPVGYEQIGGRVYEPGGPAPPSPAGPSSARSASALPSFAQPSSAETSSRGSQNPVFLPSGWDTPRPQSPSAQTPASSRSWSSPGSPPAPWTPDSNRGLGLLSPFADSSGITPRSTARNARGGRGPAGEEYSYGRYGSFPNAINYAYSYPATTEHGEKASTTVGHSDEDSNSDRSDVHLSPISGSPSSAEKPRVTTRQGSKRRLPRVQGDPLLYARERRALQTFKFGGSTSAAPGTPGTSGPSTAGSSPVIPKRASRLPAPSPLPTLDEHMDEYGFLDPDAPDLCAEPPKIAVQKSREPPHRLRMRLSGPPMPDIEEVSEGGHEAPREQWQAVGQEGLGALPSSEEETARQGGYSRDYLVEESGSDISDAEGDRATATNSHPHQSYDDIPMPPTPRPAFRQLPAPAPVFMPTHQRSYSAPGPLQSGHGGYRTHSYRVSHSGRGHKRSASGSPIFEWRRHKEMEHNRYNSLDAIVACLHSLAAMAGECESSTTGEPQSQGHRRARSAPTANAHSVITDMTVANPQSTSLPFPHPASTTEGPQPTPSPSPQPSMGSSTEDVPRAAHEAGGAGTPAASGRTTGASTIDKALPALPAHAVSPVAGAGRSRRGFMSRIRALAHRGPQGPDATDAGPSDSPRDEGIGAHGARPPTNHNTSGSGEREASGSGGNDGQDVQRRCKAHKRNLSTGSVLLKRFGL